jgi:microcystin-dependent protein
MAYPDFDPLWAIEDTYLDGVTPNKIRPGESLRNYGYLPNAEPTAQELNWQLNNVYQQLAELKTIALGAYETPVNELKIIVGDNRNPATIYGYGTWTPFAQGRTLIGAGTGTDTNGVQRSYSEGSTGGTYEEVISKSQLPAHEHSYEDSYLFEAAGSVSGVPTTNKKNVGFINGGFGSGDTDADNNTLVFRNNTTGSVGGNQPTNNVQPYVAVFIWRRTA